MSSDPQASQSLPPNANLEQQKKQARELLRAPRWRTIARRFDASAIITRGCVVDRCRS